MYQYLKLKEHFFFSKMHFLKELHELLFKGALDNFNIIHTFFSKKIEITISSEAYACKMTTC